MIQTFHLKHSGTSEILILCWIILSTPLLKIKLRALDRFTQWSVFWKMNRETEFYNSCSGNLKEVTFNEVNSLLCNKDRLMAGYIWEEVFVL